MTTVVILPHPGENAVFFEAARKLFLSELSLCAARLDAPGENVRECVLGGVKYYAVDMPRAPLEADLLCLSRLSGAYALYCLEGELLRPLPLLRRRAFGEDLSAILKYSGKTNALLRDGCCRWRRCRCGKRASRCAYWTPSRAAGRRCLRRRCSAGKRRAWSCCASLHTILPFISGNIAAGALETYAPGGEALWRAYMGFPLCAGEGSAGAAPGPADGCLRRQRAGAPIFRQGPL